MCILCGLKPEEKAAAKELAKAICNNHLDGKSVKVGLAGLVMAMASSIADERLSADVQAQIGNSVLDGLSALLESTIHQMQAQKESGQISDRIH